ncbi:MAG: DUF2470 domain-containing protein [Polyangiaceae bacterium]|nr:DUF2470 domain-containing protein [Polyangiaceae bacterium]
MSGEHERPGATLDNGGSTPGGAAKAARAPSHAERCRTLAQRARSATLCTIAREPAGYPYGSLVTIAFDHAGRPLLLLSSLAEHTSNLSERPEASVLVAEAGQAGVDPLALGRMTLIGACGRIAGDDEVAAAREAFLAAQPGASHYVDFKDFSFHRLEPVSIRYVGGFGRMSWVDPESYVRAEADPLADASPGIVSHMNEDHPDAVLAYARALAGIDDATEAAMTAVDRYGFEIRAVTPAGPRAARIGFEAPVAAPDEVRRAMIDLLRAARAAGR